MIKAEAKNRRLKPRLKPNTQGCGQRLKYQN